MPRHLNHVEAYAGGLAVLLARNPEDPRLWKGRRFAPSEACPRWSTTSTLSAPWTVRSSATLWSGVYVKRAM
jgi:hypothetical protein